MTTGLNYNKYLKQLFDDLKEADNYSGQFKMIEKDYNNVIDKYCEKCDTWEDIFFKYCNEVIAPAVDSGNAEGFVKVMRGFSQELFKPSKERLDAANDFIEKFDEAFPLLINFLYKRADVAQDSYLYMLSLDGFKVSDEITQHIYKIADDIKEHKRGWEELKEKEKTYKEYDSHLDADLKKEYETCVAETETEEDAKEDYAGGQMVYMEHGEEAITFIDAIDDFRSESDEIYKEVNTFIDNFCGLVTDYYSSHHS